jgi:hypothetical protein
MAPVKLIALLGGVSFAKRAPALAVPRNAIGGLRNAGLQKIPNMCADIPRLVPSNVEFLLGSKRAEILRLIVGSHEVGDNPENSLGNFVVCFLVFVSGVSFGRTLRGLRGFWLRGVWFFLRTATPTQHSERQ